jgi:phosphohistidine phosphatase
MRLLVFRHGIAEQHAADGTDASRALTAEGVERTRAAARGLARIADPLDVILTSPRVRAVQTATEAAAAFRCTVEVLEALSGGPPSDTLRALAARGEQSVMIVGHEPTLSELVEQVCTGGSRLGFVDMRKAGCACLEVGFQPGGDVTAATLLWLATPRILRALDPG